MGEGVALARSWWRSRPVIRLTQATLFVTVTVLAACARAVHDDGSVVPVAELVTGHRYLLTPLAVLAALACSVAGSLAATNAAWGATASVAVTFRSVPRGVITQLVASGAAAAAWFVVVATTVAVVAAAVIGLVGGAPEVTASSLWALVLLIGRLALLVLGVGALTTALGFVLPGSPIPAMVPIVGVALAEGMVLVATSGRVDVILGQSYAFVAVGAGQPHASGVHTSTALALSLAAWVGAPLLALALSAVGLRWRPLPS